MDRIVLKSKVSSDGILHLSLLMGMAEADQEVQVTVEPSARRKPLSQEEWAAWVEAMAGSWQGSFERPPQDAQYERV